MFFGANKSAQPATPAPQSFGSGATIFDVGIHNFEQDVIAASMSKPVIVDFWAPWCGPCKQLMPVLERAVNAANGQVLLAKINIDENEQLAAMMRVQSVPTVYAFFQGQPVDGFQGNIPESQIKIFVEKLLTLAKSAQPEAIDIPEALKGAAAALAENDAATAQAIYAQILQQDSLNAPAYVGMVRCFLAVGQVEQAQSLIDNAPEAIAKAAVFAEAKAALELANAVPAAPTDAFLEKIAKDPADHAARIDLAYALFAAGKKTEATDALLESIALDREWNDQAARKELLTLFSAMGFSDPVTVAARKKLSAILFS